LIPVFFVSTGVGLDITSLFHSTRAIIDVPIFLVALLVVRGGYLLCCTCGLSGVLAPWRPVSCKPRL
jgi:Kef-type K+ transport system membrane component KefB